MTDSASPTPVTADLLYGCEAIGEYLGLTRKQLQHRIAEKRIPHFRVGKTICATRSTLRAWLDALDAGSPLAMHR